MSPLKDIMTSLRFDPISERPLPFSPVDNGVAVPLLWSGSSSRFLRSLLEALPLRSGSQCRARFATTSWSFAFSSARNIKLQKAARMGGLGRHRDVDARSTSTVNSTERCPILGHRSVIDGRGRVLRVVPSGRSSKPCRSESVPTTIPALRRWRRHAILPWQGTPNEKRRPKAAIIRLVAGAGFEPATFGL